jgi:hypothetical protein
MPSSVIWKSGRGKRFSFAWLMVFLLLGIFAQGVEGQTPGGPPNDSLIFPTLSARSKPVAVQTNGEDDAPSECRRQSECVQPLEPSLCPCDDAECVRPNHRLLEWLRCDNLFKPRHGNAADREPWIDRPFSVGPFIGPIVGNTLQENWVGQQTGTVAGVRLGWDMDDDWGVEMRMASAEIPVFDSDLAISSQQTMDSMIGLAANDPRRLRFDVTRYADHFLWDIDFLYYPLGDANWRPYLMFGFGFHRVKFEDRLSNDYARILAGMPIALGVKSRLNDWLAFRVECTDNVAFAGGSTIQTQHDVALTGAFEIRLGRAHTNYWPWNPGK